MRTLTLILLGMLTLTSIALTRSAPTEPPEPALRPPIICWMGSFSEIDERRGELVTDPDRWLAVCREHIADNVERTASGPLAWPQIDFDRYSVLCLFDGPSRNTNGLAITGVAPGEDVVRVVFARRTFQTASRGEPPERAPHLRSFGFALIDRPSSPVVVEEMVQSLKAEPPRPVERYRLMPPASPAAPATPPVPAR